MKIGYAYREAKALLSAVELGVFTALSEGPLGVDELRNRIGIHERGARDFFDALVALRLLDRDGAGRYANTPDTAYYLDRSKPSYGGGELEFINAQLYERWNDLTAALRTGRPQTRVEPICRSGGSGIVRQSNDSGDIARCYGLGGKIPVARLRHSR